MKTINPLPSQHPDDDNHQTPHIPSPSSPPSGATADQTAAAEIVRGQIDRLYGTSDPKNPTAAPKHEFSSQGERSPSSPYSRTHHQGAPATVEQSEAWQRYHSAWQQYYQRYYQRYYMQQLEQQKQKSSSETHSKKSADSTADNDTSPTLQNISHQTATSLIHKEIVDKVKKQASSVQRSHHFMPILTAVMVGVLFMFLQYNRLFTAQVKAYVAPGSNVSQSIILDPVTDTKVGPEPRIIIPKINVDAPIVYGVNSLADGPVQVALRDGVVHYPLPGANSTPGQAGNTVLLGHSSNDVFDAGQYKFVFVLLERLEQGDTFYLHHNSTRYTYQVTKKEVIDPTEVSKLIVETDKPLATLVTCVPPGTALKRLVVWAEQISPDPSKVTEAPAAPSSPSKPTNIAGDGTSFLDRLFGN